MQVKRLAAALVAATPLFAAAQTNVTLYGVVDAAIESADNGGAAGRVTRVQSGDQSASRIGFRGTEDLGNGLKAIFNLEAGVAVDTGAADSNLFQRRAVVGLEGSFGTVTVGREYSPLASVAGATDEFGQGFYGSNLSAFGTASPNPNTTAVLASPRLTRRLSNSISYKSASYAGFKVLAAYAAGENTDTNAPGSSTRDYKSVGAEYTQGNLYVGTAYAETKRLNSRADKEYGVGAAYTFTQWGGFDIKGNYLAADARGENNKFSQWNLGAGYPFGASKVLVNYQRNRVGAGKGHVVAVAYTYSLSKRTNVYASYADGDNNRFADFGLTSAGSTVNSLPQLGGDPSAFTIGVRHSF